MKQLCYAGLGLAVILGTLGCQCTKKQSQALSLTEKDLSGWSCFLEDPDLALADVWHVDQDVLVCRGTPRGYLYTDSDYRDFSLKVDWRWPPGQEPGKGGILVRMTGEHGIWPRSLEAQINVGDAGDFWGLKGYALSGDASRRRTLDHETFGRLTHLQKTGDHENPPGQWNTYEVVARGETVTLFINGIQVNQAVECDTESGKICLTSEGSEIHFRNLSLIAK
jgi:hypothetical protein